ncbi:hypothetical protein KUCAC02_034754 [Chaenocephalus aceratus]|nr:hypothetical protein KUCAC02_034754 [Chaenocephalus aceratus]
MKTPPPVQVGHSSDRPRGKKVAGQPISSAVVAKAKLNGKRRPGIPTYTPNRSFQSTIETDTFGNKGKMTIPMPLSPDIATPTPQHKQSFGLEEARILQVQTTGQAACPLRHKEREGRLTASERERTCQMPSYSPHITPSPSLLLQRPVALPVSHRPSSCTRRHLQIGIFIALASSGNQISPSLGQHQML